ncbi:MAG: sulfotransferase domain-containing protein [Luminiphilus sp.]|nr:sulfotransferase domain-containing protein [Luminiphilus sp.]
MTQESQDQSAVTPLRKQSAPNVTKQLTHLRSDPSSTDFYICEFPKSGVTFLTVLIANALLIANGYSARATFASVRNYIVDLCIGEHVASHAFQNPPLRFYKIHSVFSPQFIHSLYLVRHPVDVMASNLRYAIGRGWWQPDNSDDFLSHPILGIEAWKRHVQGWLVDNSFASDVIFVHLLRYEDLVSDSERELRNIDVNFGWHLPEAAITGAVEAASRENMRNQESMYRQHNPNHKFEFVSSLGSEVAPNFRERVIASCAEELNLLGY